MNITASLPKDTVKWLADELGFKQRFGDEAAWPADEVTLSVCERAGIPIVPLTSDSVDYDAFEKLNELCVAQRFLPTYAQSIVMGIVTPKPYNAGVLREIRRNTHKELRVLGCLESEFDQALAEADARLLAIKNQRAIDNPPQTVMPAERWTVGGGPMSMVVREIVTNAVQTGASDILIEPQEDQVDVRFFYGDKWEVMPPIESRYRDGLVKAVKDAAGMSSLSNEPFQGGKATMTVDGRRIDLRIEVAPFTWGEGVTLRVLESGKFKNRSSLPFLPADCALIDSVIHKKQGIVLVVGPTGSGKSTLSMQLLTMIDPNDKHILTIEDPPEYTLDRIGQMEVGEKVGRTFKQALKSTLRQKPDVVFVGEIRDWEVANIAVEEALTGHIVIATLHTNDSAGVSPRLIEMKVPPYVLQSTLLAVVAVRLVPVLCPNCKHPEKPSPKACAHFAMHGLPVPEVTYTRVGCHQCRNLGTKGRRSMYEIMHPNDALKEYFQEGVSEAKIREAWVREGGVPMVRYGLTMVAAGEVEWTEVVAYETRQIVEPAAPPVPAAA